MKKLAGFFFLFLLISITSFAQDVDKLRAKIEAMNKIYSQAMLDNDTEKMLSLYTDDIISMPSYQPTVKGITKVRELSEIQAKSGWKTTQFALNISDIIVAGNLAIEIGNYTMKMSGPEVPEWADNGKYMTIWEEQKDGSLKIKVETWNTDTNPWAQMEQSKQEEMKKID
jgi:ketosteroid isomerase-like protein